MARSISVKLVMMQKDERLLLEPWLRYHGYLFGYENLTVLDNGSSDPDVVAILGRYDRLGVTVVRDYVTPRDFDAKGELAGDVIRQWDKTADYDYAIPIDCDEFVGLWQDGGLSCSRTDIHAYLDSVRGFQGCYKVGTNLFNLPGEAGWFWPQDATKVFFGARSFKCVDHGFHFGKSRFGAAVLDSYLTYFHFHNKPYADFAEGARNKLRPYVDVEDPIALQNYAGPGGHLLADLLNGEAAYLEQFGSALRVHVPQFGWLMEALGVMGPLFQPLPVPTPIAPLAIATSRQEGAGDSSFEVFEPSAYRQKWLDVATEGFDPLLHYVRIGRQEGRSIR